MKRRKILVGIVLNLGLIAAIGCGPDIERQVRAEKIEKMIEREQSLHQDADDAKAKTLKANLVGFLADNLKNDEVESLIKFSETRTMRKFNLNCGNLFAGGFGGTAIKDLNTEPVDAERLAQARNVMNYFDDDANIRILSDKMSKEVSIYLDQKIPDENLREKLKEQKRKDIFTLMQMLTRNAADTTANCMARHSTLGEISEIQAFYKSPIGMKMMSLLPEIIQMMTRDLLKSQ